MIEARATLQEIRDALQTGPDGRSPVNLTGPTIDEDEYFPQTRRDIATRSLSNKYRFAALGIAREVNGQAGSALVDVNATIGKGRWVYNETSHMVTYLRRIGTAWERGYRREVVGADPHQDSQQFGIYCSAEYLVCSALLQWPYI